MSVEINLSPEDHDFAEEVRTWLDEHLVGEYRNYLGVGGADDGEAWEIRLAWEKELAAGGWTCLTWPKEYGGRALTSVQEIVFEYEYAKSRAPYRVGVHGTDLFGPTLLKFGTHEQKLRFLPKIAAVEEFWGQGFSEPNAGSDLASVQTRARLEGDEWVIDGQKIWTTFGMYADWLYVVTRTDPTAVPKHRGLSLLIIPAHQPGVDIRPIRNMMGDDEFCEVFFTEARTAADLVVGEVNDGWKVAMGALGVERGSLMLPMQLRFEREADALLELAKQHNVSPALRHRIIDAWAAVRIMRTTNLRTLGEVLRKQPAGAQATTAKLFASGQHQRLLQLVMEILAEDGVTVGEDYELSTWQRSFMLSRAESIYGGTSQIQRNIIGERVLGLPKEPVPQR
jgi:alkylation response protein AidB-like acyl-CoA dehydrogenase